MSKSVRLSSRPASTGSEEEDARSEPSAGARKSQAGACLLALEQRAHGVLLPARGGSGRRARAASAASRGCGPRRGRAAPAPRRADARRGSPARRAPARGWRSAPTRGSWASATTRCELLAEGAQRGDRAASAGSSQASRCAPADRRSAGRSGPAARAATGTRSSRQAASLCCASRGRRPGSSRRPATRPDVAPSGPGSGAVAQASCSSGGRRRRNSPRFQGPVMYMAKVAARELLVEVRDLVVAHRRAPGRRGTDPGRRRRRGGTRAREKAPRVSSSASSGEPACRPRITGWVHSLMGRKMA